MKQKKRKTKIAVATERGSKRIRAIVRNGLALHPTVVRGKKPDGWNEWDVTHIISGMRLNSNDHGLPLRDAKNYFRELQTLACWHELSADAMGRENRSRIAAIARAYGVAPQRTPN